ncbi:ABC transporter ATP-binding protein [Planococcus sp. N028]|uniref:ABC transporter ATP-binding protein n=1 Tax=Planococcus shixiaomingii TaxID=3058393 RepID=A0ABT8N4W5_9BACL|nr:MULTISPECIES: ABC transporter ATP-binding protein [unclassified Planococcus (in: firmicutes)]MDN7242935.1 ABC transporter ATP-binding protein [Planococcus sp. N028]WKA55441.1 ABC transporter ATP-binding protein [Planococcus sp. N022]
MGNSIAVTNLSKKFGNKTVLAEIDLSIEEGQIYGLIGPSGSGKTTLVKLMVGIDSPDSGTVDVLGKRMPNLELLSSIGYMAQSDALYSELTGGENLAFFASLYSLKKADRKKRIAYAAGLVKLAGELNKKVGTYSGGMKRRLSLAIALIHDPKILLLDEPTVGIDPELRLSIWAELEHLKREQGKTVVITTHVMDEAEKCDRVAMVRDGRILTSGSPAQLKASCGAANLEEVFLAAGRGAL